MDSIHTHPDCVYVGVLQIPRIIADLIVDGIGEISLHFGYRAIRGPTIQAQIILDQRLPLASTSAASRVLLRPCPNSKSLTLSRSACAVERHSVAVSIVGGGVPDNCAWLDQTKAPGDATYRIHRVAQVRVNNVHGIEIRLVSVHNPRRFTDKLRADSHVDHQRKRRVRDGAVASATLMVILHEPNWLVAG